MSRFVEHRAPRVWWLLFLMLAACAGDPAPAPPPPTLTPFPPDVYIGLSDLAAPLADLAGLSYEAATGMAAPVFLSGNDEALRNDLQQGALEAIIVYHLPASSQFWFTPIALDGIVMMAHPDLAVDDLTSGQLQGILSGSINNWAEIGGPNLAITLLSREPGSGARDILSQRIMKSTPFSGLARIAATDDYMQQQVLSSPGAIGYTAKGGASGRAISLDGIMATQDSIADQSYPLTTPIYFVTLAEPEGQLRDFLAWIQSPEGQSVVGEKYGRVR